MCGPAKTERYRRECLSIRARGRGTRIHRRRGEETAEGDQPGVECETCAEGYCGSCEVPVTINGKKVETAVKQIISGREDQG